MAEECEQVSLLADLPLRAIFAGGSNTGKTFTIGQIFLNWCTFYFPSAKIRKVILVYLYEQDIYRAIKNLYGDRCVMTKTFDDSLLEECGDPKDGDVLLLIDDLTNLICNNNFLATILVGASHHLRINTFLTTQNIYASKSPIWQTVLRNANLLVIYPCPMDANMLSHLNSRIFPGHKQILHRALEMARRDNLADQKTTHHYLAIDCSVTTPSHCRLRSCILPNDKHPYCYIVT